jgi:hypothetical protein
LGSGFILEEFIRSEGAILGMVDQFQFHEMSATPTKQWVEGKGLEKPLSKGLAGKNAKAIGREKWMGREDLCQVISDGRIANMSMQAIIANALEPLGENVLNHATDETLNGKGGILDLFRAMIPIPVSNRLTIVVLNTAYGNGRRDHIFGQVTGQPLSARRHLAFIDKSD